MEPNRISDNISTITESVRDYVNLRIDYLKLLLTEKIAKLASFFLISIIFFILTMFLILFLSFAFVFWFGEEVGPMYTGALIVVAFYIFTGLLIYGYRHKIFINPLVKHLAKILMEEENAE
jgi:hypothetical protein